MITFIKETLINTLAKLNNKFYDIDKDFSDYGPQIFEHSYNNMRQLCRLKVRIFKDASMGKIKLSPLHVRIQHLTYQLMPFVVREMDILLVNYPFKLASNGNGFVDYYTKGNKCILARNGFKGGQWRNLEDAIRSVLTRTRW